MFSLKMFIFFNYANRNHFKLVEYKKFTHHNSKTSLIGMEIPTLNGGYDYPVPFKKQQILEKVF